MPLRAAMVLRAATVLGAVLAVYADEAGKPEVVHPDSFCTPPPAPFVPPFTFASPATPVAELSPGMRCCAGTSMTRARPCDHTPRR